MPIIVLATAFMGAPAHAQQASKGSESAAPVEGGGGLRAACAEDRKTYCAGVEHGHGFECLSSHASELSPTCASAVQAIMARRQAAHQQH